MMMNHRTILALVALAVIPASAQAQSASARTSTQASTAVATPEARIDAAIRAAAEADIPQSLLESKVREAEAKQASPEQTASAVEARFAALVEARSTLQSANVGAYSEGDLLVTAEALAAGVSGDAIIDVASRSSADTRTSAIATLTDVVRLGHDAGHASAQVAAALTAGADALLDLRTSVASQLDARGLAPTSVAGSATAGVTGIIRR